MKRAALVLCAALVPSCLIPGGESEREPPVLLVTAPSRAARLDEQAVTVAGRASDAASGIESVVVNGVAAELGAGGAFSVELPLAGGVSLIEVVASDGAGNQARDVRAVLSGRRSGESLVARGLMARIGPGGYGLVAAAVSEGLAATDLGAVTSSALMAVPGCFEVRMVRLQHGAVDVDLRPRAGGIEVAVAVRDVVADLSAEIGGFCDPDGSSAPMRLRADALWLRGTARLAVSSGRVTPDLSGLAATFEGVDINTALVPSQVADLLGDLPAGLAGVLGDLIGSLAGGAIDDSLGELDAVEWTTTIQGLDLTVRLAPTAVDAGEDGLAVTSSVELLFAGLGPVEYVADAAAGAPPLTSDSALRLAVADDVANLTLAALWVGGFLDRSVVMPEDHPARTRFGLDRLELALLLPPMVTNRAGSARIVIGDALFTAYDLEGAAVMHLAASAVADLALSAGDGALLTLVPDQAELWASPLTPDGGSSATLDLPEPLRVAALDELTRFLGDSLAALPVPELGDLARVSGLAAVPGYVVLDADLAAP
jgi:hypothetical protein